MTVGQRLKDAVAAQPPETHMHRPPQSHQRTTTTPANPTSTHVRYEAATLPGEEVNVLVLLCWGRAS